MNHFVLADNKTTLIFWFFIVLSSFVAFIYLFYITLRQYLEYKTDVDLRVSFFLFIKNLFVCN